MVLIMISPRINDTSTSPSRDPSKSSFFLIYPIATITNLPIFYNLALISFDGSFLQYVLVYLQVLDTPDTQAVTLSLFLILLKDMQSLGSQIGSYGSCHKHPSGIIESRKHDRRSKLMEHHDGYLEGHTTEILWFVGDSFLRFNTEFSHGHSCHVAILSSVRQNEIPETDGRSWRLGI